ncbi:MAG: hypothetical protein KBA08_05305 [Firmicutes bacterium]|nr:hypothetical protein [Bacillota bacterium]
MKCLLTSLIYVSVKVGAPVKNLKYPRPPCRAAPHRLELWQFRERIKERG